MKSPLTDFQLSATRSLERCDVLAKISSMPNGICRTYLTPEHNLCNDQVEEWMAEAGMKTWIDAAGNCCGRYHSQYDGTLNTSLDAPLNSALNRSKSISTLLLGSHLDTVVNSGAYDGILGVLCAIEIIDYFYKNHIRFPFNIDVIGFGDEEGVRFGATLLGSRAVAGTWEYNWFSLKDKDKISLNQALEKFHGDRYGQHKDISLASRANDNILAYLELHIEQGPVLQDKSLPVGIVSSIAGARRFSIDIFGMAGHAGTVPMNMRSDALVISSKLIVEIEKIAQKMGVVATVGKLDVSPGAVNVIPGKCCFTLDIRSGNDQHRDQAVVQVFEMIESYTSSLTFSYSTNEIHKASAVACSDWLQKCTENAIKTSGFPVTAFVSGAGHDAMALSDICDVGMIFVRCKDGISHHPAESVTNEDVAWGIQVLANTVKEISIFRTQ